MARGYFGIGVEHGKSDINIGTLWRSANILGAAFVFAVGRRYKRQPTDTLESWRHIPLYHYTDLDDLCSHMPHDCLLVGVEMDASAVPLAEFKHPQRAVYLLGSEDKGLTVEALERCQKLVVLHGDRSMNVSVAGSIVLHDRVTRWG